MSITLEQIQHEFKHYLFFGSNEKEMCELITNKKNIDPSLGLDVYRDAYYIRLQEALAHDFPVLLSAMGHELFGQEITLYLQAHPSTQPSLRYLGQFLAEWFKSKNLIAFRDIALIEWAILNAFDAANVNALTSSQLHKYSPELWHQLKLTFVPTVTLLKINSNASDLWKQHYKSLRSKNVAPQNKKLEPKSTGTVYLVVYCGQKGPAVHEIQLGWYTLVLSFMEGLSLGEACEEMSLIIPEIDIINTVAQCITHCVANRWLIAQASLSNR